MGNPDGVDGPASTAQCFYCFEVLSSNFDNSTPPSLASVVQSWQEYEAARGPAPDTKQTLVDHSNDLAPASGTTTNSTSTTSSRSTTDASAASSNTSLSSAAAPKSSLLAGLSASYPVYVTWNTLSRRGKSLRGCIGTFEALPLEEGLKTYTLVSALEDYRFSPIPSSLVPQLGCELTLLADFEPCADVMDWVIGTHGLRISFIWRGRRHGATYLPHVCPEQGWDKEECLVSLMAKAGFEPERRSGGGSIAKRLLSAGKGAEAAQEEDRRKPWEMVQEMNVVRYTGFHASASHQEWQDWREWASART